MKPTSLTDLEINDLIRKYKSELRKLEFQIHRTQNTIFELQELQKQGGMEPDYYSPTLPPKTNNYLQEIQTKKSKPAEEKIEFESKRNNKEEEIPLKSPKRGYRLSEWDLFILKSLQKAGKIMVNSEFFDQAMEYKDENNIDLNESQIRGKISRSIHKLANKRNEIIKVSFPGKGYAYGLNSWFSAQGKLKKKYSKEI